jgi:hypothetical protein
MAIKKREMRRKKFMMIGDRRNWPRILSDVRTMISGMLKLRDLMPELVQRGYSCRYEMH